MSLSVRNTIVQRDTNGGFIHRTVLGVVPNDSFSVRLLGLGGFRGIGIGIGTADCNKNSRNANCTYVMNTAMGKKAGPGDSDFFLYDQDRRGVEVNQVVLVQFDRVHRTLSFSVDGRDLGEAFSGIPDGDWFPAVIVRHQGDKVEILS